MLMPKRVKRRKVFRGRMKGKAQRGNFLAYGDYGLQATERGLLIVDENNMTTREGVFAAGDVVHGSLTVVHAVNDAKNAANAMIRYMESDRKGD